MQTSLRFLRVGLDFIVKKRNPGLEARRDLFHRLIGPLFLKAHSLWSEEHRRVLATGVQFAVSAE